MWQNIHAHVLRILAFKEGDRWVAQCLEHDVAAQAPSLKELFYEMERTLVGTVVVSLEKGLPGLEELPPAPQVYWDAFAKASFEGGPVEWSGEIRPGIPQASIPRPRIRVLSEAVAR